MRQYSEFDSSGRMARVLKWGALSLPAGAITLSLFVAMTQAIAVEYISPSDPPTYELKAYVETPKLEESRPVTVKPMRLDVLDLPPLPKPISTKLDVDLTPVDFTPITEASYKVPGLESIVAQQTSLFIDTDMRPIQHPIPVYPRDAAKDGVEGWCDVSLSVSPRGDPFDVSAECTHRVFESAAERAVKKSKFTPKIVDGTPVTVVGVVYPLEFRLE